MPTRHLHRSVLFDVIDDHLVRTVIFSEGHQYTHRCTRDVFCDTAYAIEKHADKGVTLDELVQAMDAPHTQVAVALDFMKEHGCVVTRLRRNYPASNALYEDAMTEFMFLAEAPY